MSWNGQGLTTHFGKDQLGRHKFCSYSSWTENCCYNPLSHEWHPILFTKRPIEAHPSRMGDNPLVAQTAFLNNGLYLTNHSLNQIFFNEFTNLMAIHNSCEKIRSLLCIVYEILAMSHYYQFNGRNNPCLKLRFLCRCKHFKGILSNKTLSLIQVLFRILICRPFGHFSYQPQLLLLWSCFRSL